MFLELPKAQILPAKPQTPGTFKGFKKSAIISTRGFTEPLNTKVIKTSNPFFQDGSLS
jgi:hypothetical protein